MHSSPKLNIAAKFVTDVFLQKNCLVDYKINKKNRLGITLSKMIDTLKWMFTVATCSKQKLPSVCQFTTGSKCEELEKFSVVG